VNRAEKEVSVTADGTVEVFVPLAFRRIGGRKRVIAPTTLQEPRPNAQQLNMPIIRALARARHWQRLLEHGTYANILELAGKEKINKSYVSRTLRLMLLAPDIIEAVLDGRQPPTLLLDDLEGGFPIEWGLQRQMFHCAV